MFFRTTLTSGHDEELSLSMNYAITSGATWRMTSGSIVDGWNDYSYADSTWTEVTLGSETLSASGTQYFRKQFVGIANMAAYEVALYYKSGVIAYINGAEVYRDNMPDTAVSPSTAATGSYTDIGYHGFIRPGSEVSAQQMILAVEVHFVSPQTGVDFNAYVATLAPSTPSESCFIYGYDTTITSTGGYNSAYLFDFGTTTSFQVSPSLLPVTVSFTFDGFKPFINGIRMWPYAYASYLPDSFKFQGSNDNQAWTDVISVSGAVYTNSVYHFYNGYFSASLFNHYRLNIESCNAVSINIYEFQPLICATSTPTEIVYTPNTFTFWAVFEEIYIRPDVTEFTSCTSTALPEGLTLDPTTCAISGVITTSLPVTTVTVTSVTNGVTYTGSFSFSVNLCSGTVLNILRTYKGSAYNEAFDIKDASTEEVILSVSSNSGQGSNEDWTTVVCATGSKYTVSVSSTTAAWAADSYLYVRSVLSGTQMETILRLHYDTYGGFATSRTFNVQYAFDVHSNWYFKHGVVDSDWYSGSSIDGWTEGNDSNFSNSTNQIQLYKKTFTVSDISNIAGFVLSLKFKYGCVVFMNGVEAYRKGFSDATVSTSSFSDNIYTQVMYRQVSLPIKAVQTEDMAEANYIQQGSNTIAIALIAANENQKEAIFDGALRLMGSDSESRVFDYTVSYSTMYGYPSYIFNQYYSYYAYYYYCSTNYVSIIFNNDRHEWINSVTLKLHYQQEESQPRQFVVKARDGSGEYTTLTTVSGLTWSQVGQAMVIYFQNNKAYSEYRFQDLGTGNTADCYWEFNSLDLKSLCTTMTVPELAYPSTTIFKDIEMGEIYPNSEYYYDFQIAPDLPPGITLNPNTGMISGTASAEMATTSYAITAKKWSGGTSTAIFSLTVDVCTGGRSLITLVVRTDNFPSEGSYKLYQGVGTSGSVVAEISEFKVEAGLNYGDFCLDDGLYTIQLLDANSDGWITPSGYYLTVDLGAMIFELGHMPAGVASVSTMFSSYLPFQIEYTEWKISFETVPNWNTVDFDDSAWDMEKAINIGTNEKVTTYIRKEVSIPDINTYMALNIRMKYSGGVAAYFNGVLVARFNLQENFDENTVSLEVHDATTFSKFHVLMTVVEAVTGKNIMAFEIHQPVGQSSAIPVVFDATGVFGVNDCSVLVDSFAEVTAATVYQASELDILSLNPVTVGYLENVVGGYVEWTVENLEGTRFNSFAMQVPYGRTGLGFSLYLRYEKDEEYTSALEVLDQALVEKSRNRWSVPVGIAGFKELRYEIDVPASNYVYVSSFVLEYCKSSASGICPGIDGYPAVAEGEISPASCEMYYSGYSYRVCSNGQLGEVKTDKCKQKQPGNLAYSTYLFSLVVGTNVNIEAPTYDNIIERFYLSDGQTLPVGLVLNEKTGAITGVPTEEKIMYGYTIYGENQSGTTSVVINIVVKVGVCLSTGFCMATYVLYIIIAVVVVIIVVVIIIIVKVKSNSSSQPPKASGSVKPSASKKTLSKKSSAKTTAVKV